MIIPPRSIMLVDISTFYVMAFNTSEMLFKSLNININSNTNGFDLFIEWCINECFINHYGATILKHYKVDEFKVIYSNIKPLIDKMFTDYVVTTQLNDYMGNLHNTQFRTVVNARDLFVMKRFNL
jgi:hypothetical protein